MVSTCGLSPPSTHEVNETHFPGKGAASQAEPFDRAAYRERLMQHLSIEQLGIEMRELGQDDRAIEREWGDLGEEDDMEDPGQWLLNIDPSVFGDDINRPSSPGVRSEATEPSVWEPEEEEAIVREQG